MTCTGRRSAERTQGMCGHLVKRQPSARRVTSVKSRIGVLLNAYALSQKQVGDTRTPTHGCPSVHPQGQTTAEAAMGDGHRNPPGAGEAWDSEAGTPRAALRGPGCRLPRPGLPAVLGGLSCRPSREHRPPPQVPRPTDPRLMLTHREGLREGGRRPGHTGITATGDGPAAPTPRNRDPHCWQGRPDTDMHPPHLRGQGLDPEGGHPDTRGFCPAA